MLLTIESSLYPIAFSEPLFLPLLYGLGDCHWCLHLSSSQGEGEASRQSSRRSILWPSVSLITKVKVEDEQLISLMQFDFSGRRLAKVIFQACK